MTPVILCADDYGISRGVSEGILALAARGRLSATSVMANGAAWPGMASGLSELKGRIGVGLHLNLSFGAPLGAMPQLAPAGRLPRNGSLILHALTGRLPLTEIAAEIERQLDAFAQALGQEPDFVDGHQHVHVLPGIRATLLAILQGRRRDGQWLRDPSDAASAILRRPFSPKALVVSGFAAGFARQARAAGFATNEGFSGFSDFSSGGDVATLFEGAFERLGRQPLVMCHPGRLGEDSGALDDVTVSREREQAFLDSAAFGELLIQKNIALVSRPVAECEAKRNGVPKDPVGIN